MKLRLLLFKDCNRNCAGCCNKDWDLDSLPVATSYTGYSEVLLTGGEPMLNPLKIHEAVDKIRAASPSTKIYLYTADASWQSMVIYMLGLVDGMTLTLHDSGDLLHFFVLNSLLERNPVYGKSLRLNVFAGVKIPKAVDLSLWQVKPNIVWIKDCPLPTGEVLMRYEREL